MAAIIAQISLAARERKRRAIEEPPIDIQKSTYILPRFDDHFDPEVHNVYMQRRVMVEERRELLRLRECQRIEDLKRRRRSCIPVVPFSWRLCLFESVIIGGMLLLVPVAMLVVDILFRNNEIIMGNYICGQ
eukprot:GFUD01047359.1.p1 GENE.GFUD01047359.1~~GFUD01047359.1.p1  ORF type:complete len:132 (+),score=20.35 GFUD01047359.1:33-428(+)